MTYSQVDQMLDDIVLGGGSPDEADQGDAPSSIHLNTCLFMHIEPSSPRIPAAVTARYHCPVLASLFTLNSRLTNTLNATERAKFMGDDPDLYISVRNRLVCA